MLLFPVDVLLIGNDLLLHQRCSPGALHFYLCLDGDTFFSASLDPPSLLSVQHLRSRDHRFVCSFCCPANDFRTVKSEPSFTLVSVAVESNSKAMERKLVSQLSAASAGEPPREGILELLKELRGCPLIHNRPAVAISYLSHLLRLDYGRTTGAGG